MSIEDNNTLTQIDNGKKISRVWSDEDVANVIGRRIIRLLELKPNEDGKYETARGYKSPAGLAKSILDVMEFDT